MNLWLRRVRVLIPDVFRFGFMLLRCGMDHNRNKHAIGMSEPRRHLTLLPRK